MQYLISQIQSQHEPLYKNKRELEFSGYVIRVRKCISVYVRTHGSVIVSDRACYGMLIEH